MTAWRPSTTTSAPRSPGSSNRRPGRGAPPGRRALALLGRPRPPQRGRAWLTGARHAGDAPAVLRAKALNGVGVIASAQGDLDDAIAAHEAALALSRAVGDETGMARSTGYLGLVACLPGRVRPRRATPRRGARPLPRDQGRPRRRGRPPLLSEVALIQGDYERATALGTESLAIYRARGEPSSIAKLVHHLGRLCVSSPRTIRLQHSSSKRAWQTCERSAIPSGTLTAQVMLARSYEGLGRLDEADELLEDAIPAARDLGDKGNTAFALYSLAHIAQTRERLRPMPASSIVESLRSTPNRGTNRHRRMPAGNCRKFSARAVRDGRNNPAGCRGSHARHDRAPLTPASLVEHERAVAAARTELGDATLRRDLRHWDA